MNCLSGQIRRTAPMRAGGSRNELVPSKTPRVNGWTQPPQFFQITAWLVYNYLVIVSFGIFIPLLPPPWNHVLYALSGLAFMVHLVSHVAAVTIDPADVSVRAKKCYAGPMPLFDRTVQRHVIQDLHCYLCDVRVGPKVKHCSVCNKCVSDFDHHCKWLNNCVGGRNYRCFFIAVSSATVGVALLLVVILFIFIQHYLDPNILRTAPQFHGVLGNETWLVFLPSAPVKTSSAGLLIVAFITAMLNLTCLLLLCHLLCFHFYLFSKGLSTYEYIKLQRQKEARSQEVEVGNAHNAHVNNNVPQNLQSSMDCEPALTHGASTCRSGDDKGPISGRLSEPICKEVDNFKKTPEKETSFHCETQNSAAKARDRVLSTIRSWKPDAGEDVQSDSVKSVDSIPQVQDPLGSSVMARDNT
ncbi:palmitoyltransferase ZDHHC11 [Entelurus aequoreus]|uniref:palmitoyltransferase ZDHHC11 n=1 Tax=Entelurus aequoreus TaxID=161455 RepID=UPI002B1D7564|nr:palmitoyltransferase ZDHHC11 [Entelurus aequoreus]